jgi:hypothetical protein
VRSRRGRLASWRVGELAIQSWLAVAPLLGLTFLLPDLAVAEVRTLRPDAGGLIDGLVTHPHVVLTRLSPADATSVEELLAASRTFVMAGWLVHLYRQHGGSTALTTDPGRLRRIDAQVAIELLL